VKTGSVSLVGAGPGDPGLITVKAVSCIQRADVIVFDRLVDARILSHASHAAELIDVGKIPGSAQNSQTSINQLLIARAREGSYVVRLKGGDPFVFGRGGEEALALAEAGIPFDVVPGVTSAVAAPAYAGIPVTHRGLSSAVTFVTGSEDPGKEDSSVDWPALARSGNTLVVLMGWRNLPGIVAALVEHSRPKSTPAALVQWGTRPAQKTITGTLADIESAGRAAGIGSPVVLVVGEVVALRQKLRWFDNRPLFGKRVLVTRTRSQASELSRLLEERGAEPVELPAIEIRPPEDYEWLDETLENLPDYHWVILTSVNGVKAVFARLDALGLDVRALGLASIAAIGPATAAELRSHGINADFVPETFVAESVIEGMRGLVNDGDRILLPRADIARDTLPKGLRKLGAFVDEVIVYETVSGSTAQPDLLAAFEAGIDVATFTSSSTVTHLLSKLGDRRDLLASVTIACIGPVTAKTVTDAGFNADVIAREYTIPGLVDALEKHFTRKDGD
jgi:uroporphyrinogen III methyltransferase/synthase